MDVEADRRAGGHILTELGLAVARRGDEVHGTAPVLPEMWAPGTTSLRTSILAKWVDHVAGLAAIQVLAPRVPVTLELDVHVHGHAPAAGPVHAVARLLKVGRSPTPSNIPVTNGGEGTR